MNNFQIGTAPVDPLEESKLFFHQFLIYDSSWPSGTVKFNAETKEFYILPDTPQKFIPEVLKKNNIPKNIPKKN